MRELKATTAQEIIRNEKDCDYMDELFGGVKMPPTQVYIKSEADKVIAELKKEKEYVIENTAKVINAQEREIRHHKYKRCFDNAWWCLKLSKAYAWSASTHRGWKIAGYYDEKAELYRKWCKRWLKIAEQFKEEK